MSGVVFAEGVSETGLHDLHRRARADQDAGEVVPEVVRPGPGRQTDSMALSLEAPLRSPPAEFLTGVKSSPAV